MNALLFPTLHFTATTGRRALVLGGGGSTGNAWLIGVVAGLFDRGLDVTDADLTIGTSAGSTAAAQIAGASPTELFAATVAPVPPHRTGAAGSDSRPAPQRPMADQLDRLRKTIASAKDVTDLRRKLGAAAIARDAESDGSWQAHWRTIVESRLPTQRWPERSVLITVVDAQNGEPVVFDRHGGVDLVDAVAASCAGGGLPYRIGDDLYIDGGYRANAENADLAVGYERVLVLSPLGGRTLHPLHWHTELAVQVEHLRAHGSSVETITPDSSAEHMFGVNAMDLSLRPRAAQAGYDQGRTHAEQLREFWG